MSRVPLHLDPAREEAQASRKLARGPGEHPDIDAVHSGLDIVRIVTVDTKTQQVDCFSLLRGLAIPGAAYGSPQFDCTSGNGSYGPPVPGSIGIIGIINQKAYLLVCTGAFDESGETGYANNRESLPPGGWATRPARDTKILAIPGLIVAQAANLCRFMMRRATKALEALVYNFKLETLAGVLEWGQGRGSVPGSPKPKDPARFWLELRDRLRPGKTASGNRKPDEANLASVEVGKVGDLILEAILQEAKAKEGFTPFGAPVEEPPVQLFRVLLTKYFEQRSVSRYEDLTARERVDIEDPVVMTWLSPIGPTRAPLVAATDASRERLVESVIGTVTWVSAAESVRKLLRFEDNYEDGDTDELRPVIEIQTDPVTGEKKEVPTVLRPGETLRPKSPLADRVGRPDGPVLLYQALAAVSDEEILDHLRHLLVRIKPTGEALVEQTGPGAKLTWKTEEGEFREIAKGPFEVRSRDGAAHTGKGHLTLGTGPAGWSMGPDGILEIAARGIRFVAYEDVAPDPETHQPSPGTVVTDKSTFLLIRPGEITASAGTRVTLQSRSIDLGSLQAANPPRSPVTKSVSTVREELKTHSGLPTDSKELT